MRAFDQPEAIGPVAIERAAREAKGIKRRVEQNGRQNRR